MSQKMNIGRLSREGHEEELNRLVTMVSKMLSQGGTYSKVIDALMKEGMDEEEAIEFMKVVHVQSVQDEAGHVTMNGSTRSSAIIIVAILFLVNALIFYLCTHLFYN